MAHNCVFFAQGKCRNGPDCVFTHPAPSGRQGLRSLTRTIKNYGPPLGRPPVHDRLGTNHEPLGKPRVEPRLPRDVTSAKRPLLVSPNTATAR